MRLTLCEHNLWCADIHEYPSTRTDECPAPSSTKYHLAGQVYGKSIVYGKGMVYGASGSRVPWPNTCCFHCYYTDIAVDRTPYSRYRAAATLLKLINYGHFGRGRSSHRSRGSSSSWRRCISSINAIKACKEAESKDASHLPVRTKPPKMKLLKRSERDTNIRRAREREERDCEMKQRVSSSFIGHGCKSWRFCRYAPQLI